MEKRHTKSPSRSSIVQKHVRSDRLKIRIDPKLEKNAKSALNKAGLSISDAITIFFKQVVAQDGLPVELKIPNRESIKALRELERGGGDSFRGTPEELFAHILGKKPG
ncbi:hypothetical protein BH11PSE4_BH11PSE4_02160 [soil metagenome]